MNVSFDLIRPPLPGNRIVLGKQNIDPVPFSREISTYDKNIRRTFLGELVRRAKFLSDNFAKDILTSFLSMAILPYLPCHKIYYVPSHDSNSNICKDLAIRLAKQYGIDTVEAAFDWEDFPQFYKGMSQNEIEYIILDKLKYKATPEEKHGNVILLDDTIWTGSTSLLAHYFLSEIAGYKEIIFLCLTEVICSPMIGLQKNNEQLNQHEIDF